MTTQTATPVPLRRRAPLALAAALTLAVGLTAPVQKAQAWIPVQETGVSLVQHLLNQINTMTQKFQDIDAYAKQAEDIQRQWNDIRAKYIKMQTLMSLQFPAAANAKLERVDEMEGVNDKCNTEGSSNPLTGGLKMLKMNKEGKILEEQQKICVAREVARNKKFNATVDMMDVLKHHGEQFNRLEQQRINLSGDEQGKNEGIAKSMQSLGETVSQDLKNYEMFIQAYDNYIAALDQRQQVLAQAAMNNTKPKGVGAAVFSSVMQGVVLKGALETARSRKR